MSQLTEGIQKMLKRFVSYYKPHKKLLTLDMLAALLISLISMVYPIVTNKMLRLFDQTFNSAEIAEAVFFQEKYYDTLVRSIDGSAVRVRDINNIN